MWAWRSGWGRWRRSDGRIRGKGTGEESRLMANFKIETTLNGQPAVIHVSDKTKERAPRWQMCFEYSLLDRGLPVEMRYANCIAVKTDEKDARKLEALLIERAVGLVAAAQAEFDGRFERELEEVREFVEQVDEKLVRRAELEAEIATRADVREVG